MSISLDGLKMAGKPDEVAPAQIFYNMLFSLIKSYSDTVKGFDGHQHRILYNIRNQMEQATKVKDTKVVLQDNEIRFLNKVLYDAKTDLSTNEIRQRIHDKIQAALQKPIEDKGEEKPPEEKK
jgi:hypothetical protein